MCVQFAFFHQLWTHTCRSKFEQEEAEIPEDQPEEQAFKLSATDIACRSKAKAKPQRREPAGSSPRIGPIERRNWIDFEPGKYSLSEFKQSKKVIHLIHNKCIVKKMERFISGE